MKIIITIFCIVFTQASHANIADFYFECKSIAVGENVEAHVELWRSLNPHPMSGMSGIKGLVTISNIDFQEEVAMELFPNYSHFTLYGQGPKYIYRLVSDFRVIEADREVLGVLEIVTKDSNYEKPLSYELICKKSGK